MRATLLSACLIAVALAGLAGCGSSAPARSAGHSQRASENPDALALAAGRAFLDRYVTSQGRVSRIDQGGDTVSEGQAYGLMIAAALGERARFDAIWSWTREHLQRSDGLFAYLWAHGRVINATPATDADLEIAGALLQAECRFHRPDLRAEALRIGRAILRHETGRASHAQVLLAGPWANKGRFLVFDPSYVDPLALQALAQVSGDPAYTTLANDGMAIVDDLSRPLPPDWAIVNTASGVATPVSGASSTSGPGRFSYDAPRALVWSALDPNPAGRAAAARAWSVFSATRPADIVTVHALSGAAEGSDHNPVTLVAAAAAARAAGDRSAVAGLLDAAATLNREFPTYYGAAWLALGRLLLSTGRITDCMS